MRWVDWVLCKLGKCRQCVIFHNSIGIGGRCTNCSQLHGWMTHDELRAILEGRRGGHFATPLDKYEEAKPVVVTPPRMWLLRGPRGWQ